MPFARDWKPSHLAVLFLVVLVAASLTWKRTTSMHDAKPKSPYKAPLKSIPEKYMVEPITYIVYLAPGHGLDKLSETIGRDITPYVGHVLDLDYYVKHDQVVFLAERVDDELLEAIRSDVGVQQVEYNPTWPIDDFPEQQQQGEGYGPQ